MASTTSDTQQVRTAVIGFGISGRVFHSPLVAADPAYSLDVIVTSNPERAAQAAALYPNARVVATAKELYADTGNLDLIIIGTPPATHFALASTAIEHKLNVVIDKPFASNSDQAQELIAQAETAGVLLTVFQNRRWDADFLTLQRLINQGDLGQVRSFESRFEWWRPGGFQNWRDEATLAEAGGILHDLGAHLIDQVIQLFGPVSDCHGETTRISDPIGSDADQEAFVSLQHKSGVRSRLWMNGMAAQVGARFHVLGSTTGYTKWGLDSQEPSLDAGILPTDPQYGVDPEENWGHLGIGPETTPVPPDRGSYPEFYRRLALALNGAGALPVDPANSLQVLQIIEKIHHTA
ncbi:Gfo/Idh/MocA family oxidoreductase [Arthrobacter sp. A2-55]|uniref:Gfo/Idh/MocA family protein n=1 Tax=Arthrobacter sp. A2-55 TaxID=2897337 RepID=UPI0021CD4C1F|nr:Gfo/Idh/MocA family oxidoreductase [Arthrobacter sp. A2-55]MCU6479805.1 Gfo/Idh/MocA family oxidoreductase [Arthrobacter sp. A2-55]